MNTTQDMQSAATVPEPDDPFYYGWRDVKVNHPDNTEDYEQIPLTPEDVLHPRFGDKIVLGHPHSVDCGYLIGLFRARVAADPSAVVLSDQGILWDDRKLRFHAPDIAVIFGDRRRKGWKTFRVKREGNSPSLIVEITSLATRSTDLGKKVDH